MTSQNTAIEKEILRLSYLIALSRAELFDLIVAKKPPSAYEDIATALGIMIMQKFALQSGHYEELPYNIKQL